MKKHIAAAWGVLALGLVLMAGLAACGGSAGKLISDVTKIEAYLAQFTGGAEGEGEAALALNVPLTAENWTGILDSLEKAGVQVRLDLSKCKRGSLAAGGGLRSDGVFDADADTGTGKKYIGELILPRAATAIADGTEDKSLFSNFTSLKSVSGENITSIGGYTFRKAGEALTRVNFPKAATIGVRAFSTCTGLTSAGFPKAKSISEAAFIGCSALTSVSFPAATAIGDFAFQDCAALTSVSFPAATAIGDGAFVHCAALTSVDIPKAAAIGMGAFGGCAALTSVSFPAATAIGDIAFYECAALTSVNFPKASVIGYASFDDCKALTKVSAPAVTEVGNQAFDGCKALAIVDIPAGAKIGKLAFSGTPLQGKYE